MAVLGSNQLVTQIVDKILAVKWKKKLFLKGVTKYQHFLASNAHIPEMRTEIEKVTVAWAL